MVCLLCCPLSSGAQFNPTATITSLSVRDWGDVCLETLRITLIMDALYQLAHLPAHANARLTLFWGINQGTAARLEAVSSFRPLILVIETPADGALCGL